MSESYRSSTIKRRTAAQVAQMQAQILDVLRADHPQSVRHIFYRMTDPRLAEHVEKSERGYRQVQHVVLMMRRNGLLDYGWISDASRRGYHVNTHANASDFIRQMASLYRADLWQRSKYYCEVWCESRSIAGVIQADCDDLAVSLFPSAGFSSATFIYESASAINASVTKPVKIFYIGDFDPAGVLIDRSIERELRGHLQPHIQLDFRRLAINPDQIKNFDLPSKPRKTSDNRAVHVKRTVEAEAMPATILRKLLRLQVESLLPARALKAAKIAEESERSYLEMLADAVERAR